MTDARVQRVDALLRRRQPDLTVLMERVHKPHNFAAVLRTCDAVGVLRAHAVTPPGEPLPISPQTAQGAQKWVPVSRHKESLAAIEALHEQGFALIAAHFGADARPFREVDYTRPTAVVLGTERFGLTPEAAARVDTCIEIPMFGMTRSLNVSVAAAVILYEAQRQREAAGLYERMRLPDADYHRLRFEWLYPRLARWCREHDSQYPQLTGGGELPPDFRERLSTARQRRG